jgi:tyrosyl-tRNA synthetase
MLMQSYDFLKLNRDYGCRLELGGDDQWSNILGGIDLIRRCEGKEAYGMTFTLLTTSEGKKMGKTQKGALWLDPNKTTSFEFYQYFRNVNDSDVINCMKLITFIPLSEIAEYEKLEGSEINKAKMRLAFEVTKMVHGEEEAKKAEAAALNLFSGGGAAEVPSVEITKDDIKDGINIMDLLVITKLCPSKSEARRNVTQGGVSVNDGKVEDINFTVTEAMFENGELMVRRGKKAFIKVIIK